MKGKRYFYRRSDLGFGQSWMLFRRS